MRESRSEPTNDLSKTGLLSLLWRRAEWSNPLSRYDKGILTVAIDEAEPAEKHVPIASAD